MLPEARHRPVNEGKFCAGPGDAAGVDVTADGSVGMSPLTPPHATVSRIAGLTTRSPMRVHTSDG
jgi:hypothetical protein